ncbi:MAG: hypothetical protein CW338_09195 [Clostridiales bacterium]|nr:hypothetical protein [Clostridiales bacterium]
MSFPYAILAIFAAPVILFCVLYVETGRKENFPKGLAVTFKTAATLCCACFALYLTLLSPTLPKYLIYTGLLVDVAADFLLCYDFFKGMILFAAGHILYCAACVLTAVPGVLCLCVCCVLFGACFFVYYRVYDRVRGYFGTARSVGFLLYALLESVLAGFVCSQNVFMIAGVILFILSDALLALGHAKDIKTRSHHYLTLGLYYTAQMLIAVSVFFIPVSVML